MGRGSPPSDMHEPTHVSIGAQSHFPCSLLCLLFLHRLFYTRNDVTSFYTPAWLQYNWQHPVGRFHHHTVVMCVRIPYRTGEERNPTITMTSPSSFFSHLISDTLESGLDLKLRAFGPGEEVQKNNNQIKSSVSCADRRRSFQTSFIFQIPDSWRHVHWKEVFNAVYSQQKKKE